MKNILLKILCTLTALFGLFILYFLISVYDQDTLDRLGAGTFALKVSTTIIKAIFLISCAWAAFRRPKITYLLAWGAFASFVIGGAADEVYVHGLVDGLNNLIPTYYYTSFVHALFALIAWLLANPKKEQVSNYG